VQNKNNLFDQSYLGKLNKALGKSHYIAQVILRKYQEGDFDAAREGIAEIQASFEDVSYALEQCE